MTTQEELTADISQDPSPDLSPFLEVLEVTASLNQEITTSPTYLTLSELTVKESTFSFVQKMQRNDVTGALPDEDLLEDIKRDHVRLTPHGIASSDHLSDLSGNIYVAANGSSHSTHVKEHAIGQEILGSAAAKESLLGNVPHAPDLAKVDLNNGHENGQNGNGDTHPIHPWDLPENQKIFVKNCNSNLVHLGHLDGNGITGQPGDTLRGNAQHAIDGATISPFLISFFPTDGATIRPSSGFISGNGKNEEQGAGKIFLSAEDFSGGVRNQSNGTEASVEKSSHSRNKGESGETLICASSDEKISDHFPGGQGSCEVSHREGDVDQLDGSIMSRVRIFNALCTKKEERNASPAKPIVKILRKELKIVKSREGSGDRLDAKPASRHRSEVPVAAVPQGFYSLRYFMEYPRRGTAVIINNREFSMSNTPFRKGSDNDAQTLHKTMLQLGFKVEAWTDLSVKSMRDAVDYYATRIDHSDADCFFLAIFSHGEDGIIYGTDGKVNLTDLTAPFRGDKSTTLAGKPKIFVIQACRGDQLDSGVDLVEADAGSVYRIPAEADFLYAFSTPTGYFSWRNTELGSWFIQSLCRNLSEHAAHPDMDVLRLLTRVNYEVAMVNESNVPNDAKWHRKKQIPSVVSMLTKDLFFTPKSARH